MFGPRRMMRRAVRGAVLAGRGAGREQAREAQRLMANGQFVEAANLFAQLSNEAVAHGFIRPAGFLAVQAARAFAQAKHGDAALVQAKRALDIILNAGRPQQAARLMPQAIAVLRAQGFSTQAAALEKEATQRLSAIGLSLQPIGLATNLPNSGDNDLYQLQNNLTYLRGRHLRVLAGGSYLSGGSTLWCGAERELSPFKARDTGFRVCVD